MNPVQLPQVEEVKSVVLEPGPSLQETWVTVGFRSPATDTLYDLRIPFPEAMRLLHALEGMRRDVGFDLGET